MKISVGTALLAGFFFTVSIISPTALKSQDTVKLSRAEAENMFLKENLLLMAERLNIPKAEALYLQASLWPNPEFSVDQVNFPNGRDQQFSAALEQLIQTSGKRKKLMAIEQVSVNQSKQYFQDLLRNLKTEFHNQLTDLQYYRLSKINYERQLKSVAQLTDAYRAQVEKGNLPRNEYIRLKALQLEIVKSINELTESINRAEADLKTLLHIPFANSIEITDEDFHQIPALNDSITLARLTEEAIKNRPDYQITISDIEYYQRIHSYEKAQRVPDVRVKAGYDRAGGVYPNFFGIGASIDLPFFNRNQGNIHHADLARQQSEIISLQKKQGMEKEISATYLNLINASRFMENIEPGYEASLDTMLEAYTKNFINRNISLLEYLDFMEAYLENKKTILESIRDFKQKAEELNYITGTEILK